MADIAPIDGPLLANEAGSILHDYIKGEFKLSMWIPEELGEQPCQRLLAPLLSHPFELLQLEES